MTVVDMNDARIQDAMAKLPRDFYGRVVLIYEAGELRRVELTQSIKPNIDRARAPIQK
jgi:hypothetical protein